ncbi:hypothetical protein [Streptomyces sp. NPDC055299]
MPMEKRSKTEMATGADSLVCSWWTVEQWSRRYVSAPIVERNADRTRCLRTEAGGYPSPEVTAGVGRDTEPRWMPGPARLPAVGAPVVGRPGRGGGVGRPGQDREAGQGAGHPGIPQNGENGEKGEKGEKEEKGEKGEKKDRGEKEGKGAERGGA